MLQHTEEHVRSMCGPCEEHVRNMCKHIRFVKICMWGSLAAGRLTVSSWHPSSLSTSAARAFWFLNNTSAFSRMCPFSQLTVRQRRGKNCARVSISSSAVVSNPSSYVSFVLRSDCAAVMLRLLRQNQSPRRPGNDQQTHPNAKSQGASRRAFPHQTSLLMVCR